MNQAVKEAEQKKVTIFSFIENFVEENDWHFWQTSQPTVLVDCNLQFIFSWRIHHSWYSWIQNPFADIEVALKDFTAKEKAQFYELHIVIQKYAKAEMIFLIFKNITRGLSSWNMCRLCRNSLQIVRLSPSFTVSNICIHFQCIFFLRVNSVIYLLVCKMIFI